MTFINLKTLTPSPSILNNIELFEPIDYNKLNKLLNSKLNKNSSDWNETKQLSKYIKNYNSKTGLVKVKYTRNDLIEFGRVNPEFNLGLHTIRREIRHTISNDYLMDIDMVNCHPVILLQICKKYEMPVLVSSSLPEGGRRCLTPPQQTPLPESKTKSKK